MTLTTKVFSRTDPGGTPIATLSKAFARGFLNQLNEVGSGTMSVHDSDAEFIAASPAVKNYGNIVRLEIDDEPVAAFVIKRRRCPAAPKGEAAERVWTFSGPGAAALLGNARVDPDGGWQRAFDRERTFDFTAIAYDDSGWIAATEVRQQSSDPSKPTGWPDPSTWSIWGEAPTGSPPASPAGKNYFRKSFTLADDTAIAVFMSPDNTGRLWVDNKLIIDTTDTAHAYLTTWRANLTLTAGDHVVAAEITNAATTAGHPNPGGMFCAVYSLDPDTGALATLLFHSDSSWLALDYPASVPGMTVGQIMRILIEEAQDRGALPSITWSFTDSADSNALAWPDERDQAIIIGTSLLDVARMFGETAADYRMTPLLVLEMFVSGTIGADRTSGGGAVTLEVGESWEELDNDGEDLAGNSVLTRDATGELSEHNDTASLAERERIEQYLEIATAPSIDQAARVANAAFANFGEPNAQVRGTVIEAAGPLADWREGDLINVPDYTQTPVPTLILELGATEDADTGRLVYTVTGSQDDD